MLQKNKYRFGSVLCLTLWVLMPFAEAWAAPRLVVRTGQHDTYGRIVLDAPVGTTYKVARKEGTVTLSLSAPAELKSHRWRLTRARNFRVLAGQEGKGNLVVAFDVAPELTIKHFYSSASIVVDVMGAQVPLAKKSIKKKSYILPAKKSEAFIPKKKPGLAPSPKSAPVKIVHESDKLPQIKVEVRTAPVVHPISDTEIKRLMAIAVETQPKPVAVFDAQMSVGVAVFQRGGYGMLLFDRKFAKSIVKNISEARVKIEPLDLSRKSGYRIALPEQVVLRVARRGTAWEIYLVSSTVAASVSTEFVTQPDFALGARLLLSTPAPPSPILFEDPVVGDTLIVIPLKESGAFTQARRLADFEIIPSMQGLVIKPWHEKVVARKVPDGIEITSEGGLKLSPARDTGLFSDQSRMKRLFDFDSWRGRKNETFTMTRQKLMQTIVDVSAKEKLLARMDLARFYFANAMAREALALLGTLEQDVPEITMKADFLSLRGACRVLIGDMDGGVRDLREGRLENQIESVLWQAVAAAKMRNWSEAIAKFKKAEKALQDYPEPFHSRMQVLAIESALAGGDHRLANDWLTALEKGVHDPAIEPALLYMRGVVSAYKNNLDTAGVLWRKVKKSKDRLYKVRAELALVDLGVATKSITYKQAVERLEGLRFAWRGDGLEFDILKRLGKFYIDAHDFPKGLKVLAHAVRLFPKGDQMLSLKRDMSTLFRKILLTDLGKNLSPLGALTLYSDFSYLIPPGEKGNDVRFDLAEKLINIDLLEQAVLLFEEVLANSHRASEKANVSRRLAGVLLLDHHAKKALAVLDRSEKDALGAKANITLERKLLRARALSELGRNQEALAVLPNSAGRSAQLLRADIAMKAKLWPEAVSTLLDLVGPPPESGAHLSVEQAELLVKVALSMAQHGDTAGLDKLFQNYEAGMRGSSKADVFLVLTRPEKMTQFKDLAAAQEKISEIDIFQGFLNTYRKPDLDKK